MFERLVASQAVFPRALIIAELTGVRCTGGFWHGRVPAQGALREQMPPRTRHAPAIANIQPEETSRTRCT